MMAPDKMTPWPAKFGLMIGKIKNHRLAMGVVVAALLLPIGYAQTTGSVSKAAEPTPHPDLQSTLSDRSPGARGAGWLTQTKMGHTLASGPPTFQGFREQDSALGLRPSEDEAVGPLDDASPFLVTPSVDNPGAIDGFAQRFFPAGLDDDSSVGPWFAANPGAGTGGGGPGGPGPDPGPGVGLPTDPPTLPPGAGSVPEPGTWLTLIAGFFLTGSILRKQQAMATRGRVAASRIQSGIGL